MAKRLRVGSAADERIDNEGAIADTAFLKRPAFATISASAAKPNCSNGWEREAKQWC